MFFWARKMGTSVYTLIGVDTRGALGAEAPPLRFSGYISYTIYRHGKHLQLRSNPGVINLGYDSCIAKKCTNIEILSKQIPDFNAMLLQCTYSLVGLELC